MKPFVVMKDDLGVADFSKYVALTGIAIKRSRVKKWFNDRFEFVEPSQDTEDWFNRRTHDYALTVLLYDPLKKGDNIVHQLTLPASCFDTPFVDQ